MQTTDFSHHNSHHQQRGVATLLTAVVILLMSTILIFAISRTTLMEMRISGNDVRTRQAAAAAEAGLNYALAYMSQTTLNGATVPSGADKDNNSTADTIAVTTLTTGTSNSYAVAFCDPTPVAITPATTPPTYRVIPSGACPDSPGAVVCTAAPPTYLRTPRIIACGWSDDGQGKVVISQDVGTVGALAKPPTNPLTAKGAVNVQGSATVTNYFNNLTVWTGGNLTDIGNSGKTFVRNPTVAPPASNATIPTPPSQCSATSDYVCATDKNTTGPDVIPQDPTLSNLTDAQLFYNYFGVADVAAFNSNIASRSQVDAANFGTLSGVKQEAFVVNGNVSSSGNMTIGSRDQPVVMIINGDWTGGGNVTVYGVVYVTGNMGLTGNTTIYGGAVIEGSVSGTGSLDVIYDPLVTDNAANRVGKSGGIPGSWRDWK